MSSSDQPNTTALGTTNVFSGFAVPDTDAARDFYQDTLGLEISDQDGMLGIKLPRGGEVLVYPKPDHTPATYTVLNLDVSDIDAAVDELTARGVTFERYDGFEQDDKGIARGDQGPPIAWFTDPAGNIMAVMQTS
ncbi:MAG: VOC family protein [Actinomycetota bacterium]|nr:VOC family protein [Actinomycetota bacterium]